MHCHLRHLILISHYKDLHLAFNITDCTKVWTCDSYNSIIYTKVCKNTENLKINKSVVPLQIVWEIIQSKDRTRVRMINSRNDPKGFIEHVLSFQVGPKGHNNTLKTSPNH